jgi:hypothetical protein
MVARPMGTHAHRKASGRATQYSIIAPRGRTTRSGLVPLRCIELLKRCLGLTSFGFLVFPPYDGLPSPSPVAETDWKSVLQDGSSMRLDTRGNSNPICLRISFFAPHFLPVRPRNDSLACGYGLND